MRCSDAIAKLAGALAKAQGELVNPPKSLIATLEPVSSRGGAQTYRYAPLSAGLDIIRRTFSQHELAVMQTTHMDRQSGIVVLTTTLAHSSGEWIATSWPVCRVSDMAQPKLMGAALTYARRYSLFALVGITGEGDLDAPQLAGGAAEGNVATAGAGRGRRSGALHAPAERIRARQDRAPVRVRGRVTGETQPHAPSPAATAPIRGEPVGSASDLLASLEAVQDEAGLLCWAKDALPLRSSLDETGRAELDQTFLRRAEAISADPELLLLFRSSQEVSEADPLPHASIINTPPAGGHDAQAAL